MARQKRHDPNLSSEERAVEAKKYWVRKHRMTGMTKAEYMAGVIDLKTAERQLAKERYGGV